MIDSNIETDCSSLCVILNELTVIVPPVRSEAAAASAGTQCQAPAVAKPVTLDPPLYLFSSGALASTYIAGPFGHRLLFP